ITLLSLFFFPSHPATRALLSFPTRRSSDLVGFRLGHRLGAEVERDDLVVRVAMDAMDHVAAHLPEPDEPDLHQRISFPTRTASRSEEHTSELQSLRHLVCRLLLEKKKKTIN